jgi:ribonuclease D
VSTPGPALPPPVPSPDKARLVEDDVTLAAVVEDLLGHDAYAIDTEFHRERTYFPQLALLQLAWPGGLVLVDPLAVDVAALAPLFTSDAVAVVHAADQDLEVLELTVGTVPARMFDTQVAAGFLGMSTPSLSSLCERFVGVHLPKAERLTDWLARPLGVRQRQYAASDVVHLLEVRGLQLAELAHRGRLDWAEEEIELRRQRAGTPRDPDQAWTRIKEVRQLKGQARCVAVEIAAWRERRAAETDQPVRFVLPDMAVVTIAQRAPRTRDELSAVRGVDGRHTGGGAAASLLEAVTRGLEARPPKAAPAPVELDRNLRPAVALVTAWISQLGRDLEIDPSLLATRADIEAVLRGDDDARLGTGWRAELMGQRIRDLVEGRAALAFEGDGRLVLEERSPD